MASLTRIGEFLVSPFEIEDTGRHIVQLAGLDIMGCILAGATENSAVSAQNMARALGTGRSPAFGTGASLSAPMAAMCNGAAGHALEFDDWENPGNTHPSTVLFPAIWAVAGQRDASGAAVLDAYVAGFEVIARLGEAINYDHYNKGWHATATLGVLGAAAAVARLIGLSAQQSANALTLAVSQSSGLTMQGGADGKALQAGFAARDGVIAALLAEQGATGQPHVLESPRGMIALMAGTDPARLEAALDRMDGTAIKEYGVVFKPYPSCGYTHRLVDCALEARCHSGFGVNEVVSIEAEFPDFHAAIVPFHQPSNRHEAMFSAPFCVATALSRGTFDVSDLQKGRWDAAEISELIEKIRVRTPKPKNPGLNYDPDQPDRLRVRLKSGAVIEATCVYPTGAPQKPMGSEAVRAKFETLTKWPDGDAIDRLSGWTTAQSIQNVLSPFETSPFGVGLNLVGDTETGSEAL